MKRCFDFALSLMGLIALLPVFIVVAWVIKKDGSPVFFSSKELENLELCSIFINSEAWLLMLIRQAPK